ncbi:MAG: MoaD/ThiS family protein [Planctomycetes bacterium]|nr:MoaD/ThiS family protein [Planctomycetota bacterium]
MRVLLFAGLADLAQASAVDLDLTAVADTGVVHVRDLKATFEQRFPSAVGTSYQVALDHAYANDDEPVLDGQEIAFIPPVSGG